MSIDHLIGFAVGVAAFSVILAVLFFTRMVRGFRESSLPETELPETEQGTLKDLLRDRIALETAVSRWKARHAELHRKHNGFVRTHNELVRRFNELVRVTKANIASQGKLRQDIERSNQLLQLEGQELQQRLTAAVRDKMQLADRCETLGKQHEAIVADLNSQISQLAANELTDNRFANVQRIALEARIAELIAEIGGLQSTMESTERHHNKASQLISDLQQQVCELQIKNAELTRQGDKFNDLNAKLAQEVGSTRRTILELQEKYQQDANSKHQDLIAEKETLLKTNQLLFQEANRLRQEHTNLTYRVETLDGHLKVAIAGLSAGGDIEDFDLATTAQQKGNQSIWANQGMDSSWHGNRPVVIGLDFGTFSTKVVVRIRGDKKSKVARIDEAVAGYPSFVAPSLVRLNGGKLSFGRVAGCNNEGTTFRSLKVSFLPPTSTDGWSQQSFPAGTTPDLLVALYLTWVLGRVKNVLGDQGIPEPSLNVAAPMGHLENESLKERYLHVVNAAWQATFGDHPIRVEQGASLTQLRPLFEYLLEQTVADLRKRRFEVLPETLAPLVSLSQDPRVNTGFYMMVDMGAGTTELSVSHINELDADHRILCYADTSIFLGGNQFNENDVKNSGRAELQHEEDRLKSEFLRQMKIVWHSGFSNDMNSGPTIRNRWKQLNVVLSGGGLRRASLESAIKLNFPLQVIFGGDRTDYVVAWHHPEDLELPGERPEELQRSLAYLAVAHGLSLERQKWPKWHPPSSVEATGPEAPPDNPLNYAYMDW